MKYASYTEIEKNIRHWANRREDIFAILAVGSRARFEPPDIYADLDLIFLVSSYDKLVGSTDWLSGFASPWITTLDRTSAGDPEWVVIFEQGLKVDIVLHEMAEGETLSSWLENSPYQVVLARGYRILLDKTSNVGKVDIEKQTDQRESVAIDYAELLDRTLISIYRAASFARRGDLWRAHLMLHEIRKGLLIFYEFRSQVKGSVKIDTWYDGRHIESWAEASMVERIAQLFPTYHVEEIEKSLETSLQLLTYVLDDLDTEQGTPIPTNGQSAFQSWLVEFLKARSYR